MSSFVYIYCLCRLFFYKLLYTYLIRLQTEYPNFHANSATLIFMQTQLYIANPKPCYYKKNLNRGKLHRQYMNHIFIDRITEFSFIIFLDFIHFMKYLFCLLWIITCSFFTVTNYILYFYYSYVNPLTINSCDARVNNLVDISLENKIS